MRLDYSVRSSALTEPLQSGTVRPDGIEFQVFHPETTDANSRAMLELKFDVAEMSLATFTKAVERGMPLVALPVFTSGRRFVQAGIYLSRSSGISSPDELRGRGIGLLQYWISSCVWQRMVLQQMHGLDPEDVRWVTTEAERFDDVGVPDRIDLRLDTERDLAALMRDGAIDAILMPGGRPLPEPLARVAEPAYPDLVAAERGYYARTGLFPLMHVTVIKRSLVDDHPGLVEALLTAYAEAKVVARSLPDPDWPLPPLGHDLDGITELLGDDPWPYGISANREPLEAFLTAVRSQGLLQRDVAVSELFPAELPEEFR